MGRRNIIFLIQVKQKKKKIIKSVIFQKVLDIVKVIPKKAWRTLRLERLLSKFRHQICHGGRVSWIWHRHLDLHIWLFQLYLVVVFAYMKMFILLFDIFVSISFKSQYQPQHNKFKWDSILNHMKVVGYMLFTEYKSWDLSCLYPNNPSLKCKSHVHANF